LGFIFTDRNCLSADCIKYNFVIKTKDGYSMLKKFFHKLKWVYGTCTSGEDKHIHTQTARRNRFTGEVQFILWHKGEKQGDYLYTEDYWHNYNEYWWPNFRENELNFSQ